MSSLPESISIPVISTEKNYWLIRTQSGKYYREFRDKGFIGINWDDISIETITNSNHIQLTDAIRKSYPDKIGAGRTAAQLRTFTKGIKKGDTVIITGPASNKFSIGEVTEDDPYSVYVSPASLEENSNLCPFQKRRKVVWKKELHKWEMEMKFFKLLQHARNTISDANDYADLIEGMVHNFFIRGEKAQISLRVTKEGKIPMYSFFSLGTEILDLALEFNEFSSTIKIDVDDIETQINVNSPGKIKFMGGMVTITIISLIIVGIVGGGLKVNMSDGKSIELKTDSNILREVSDFIDHKQAREQKDLILKTYLKDLEIKTPEELIPVMEAVSPSDVNEPNVAESQEDSEENISSDTSENQ